MSNGALRQWLADVLTRAVAQAVGVGLLVLGAAAWAWLSGHLATTTPASVWLLGAVLLDLVIVLVLLGRRRTSRSSPPAVVPAPTVLQEVEPAPPPRPAFYKLRHLDLDWEVQPAFLN